MGCGLEPALSLYSLQTCLDIIRQIHNGTWVALLPHTPLLTLDLHCLQLKEWWVRFWKRYEASRAPCLTSLLIG